MIDSKEAYISYFQEDLLKTGLETTLKNKLLDRRYRFYKSLRRTEYYTNCRKDLIGRVIGKILRLRHRRLCDKYNWTIPINVFGSGLAIVHVGTIVVSGSAKIGKNCRIHVCTNIGKSAAGGGNSWAPVLGDNVYIGPGAKIFGPVIIGDNTAIGANAVVNTSFQEGNCTIAGVPARIVSRKTSEKLIINLNR